MKSFGRYALVVGAACIVFFGASRPASADFPFAGPSSTLLSLLPDTCVPLGSSEYCITLTNATYQSMLGMLDGQTQMGQMMSQQLKSINYYQLSLDLGIIDPTMIAQLQEQALASVGIKPGPGVPDGTGAAAQSATAMRKYQAINPSDINSLLKAALSPTAAGGLSAAQLQASIAAKQAAAQEAANQFAAAQEVQRQAGLKQGIIFATTALDVTSADPTAGWSF